MLTLKFMLLFLICFFHAVAFDMKSGPKLSHQIKCSVRMSDRASYRWSERKGYIQPARVQEQLSEKRPRLDPGPLGPLNPASALCLESPNCFKSGAPEARSRRPPVGTDSLCLSTGIILSTRGEFERRPEHLRKASGPLQCSHPGKHELRASDTARAWSTSPQSWIRSRCHGFLWCT